MSCQGLVGVKGDEVQLLVLTGPKRSLRSHSLMSVHRPSIVMHVILFPSFSLWLHVVVCSSESLSTLRQTPSTPKINAVSTIFACLVHFVAEWLEYVRTVAGNHHFLMQGKTQLSAAVEFSQNLRRTLDLQGPQVLDRKL